MQKQISTTKERLEILKNAQSQVEAQFQKGEIGAEQYRAFQREVETTKNILGTYENKLESVNNALNGNAQTVENNSKSIEGLQQETNNLLKADLLSDFSDKVAQASDKLVDLGNKSLEAFREVDAGMDIIVTKTGASGQALDEMTGIAENIATSLPTSFEAAGNAVGEVNTQFGVTGDSLHTLSEMMIRYAEINGSDITQSTILSKQALEAFGLSTGDVLSVLDDTTYVAQATGASVDDLMSKAIAGAPQIKALGLGFGEGVTLLGQFEKAGVDSSGALSALAKATGIYAKEGKSLKDGLAETIEKIKTSTSETDALNTASEIFGAKAAPRMVDAIKRGAFSFEELANTAKNSSGTVFDTYNNTLDPIDKFTTAQNTATLAMAEIGDEISATLAPVMESLARVLKSVAEWFSGLSEPVKQFAVVAGLVVVVLSALLPIIIGLKAAAIGANTSILGLVGSMLPMIGAIAAIVAVIAILVLGFKHLWNTNKQFRDFITKTWKIIQKVITDSVKKINEFVKVIWDRLVSWWEKNQETIMKAAKIAWDGIKEVIRIAINVIMPLIIATWQNIATATSSVFSIIKTVIDVAMKTISGIIKAVSQVMKGDWSGALETLKSVAQNIFEGIKNVIMTALTTISQFIQRTWQAIVTSVQFILNTLSNTFSTTWENIKAFISNTITTIATTISNVWNGIWTTIQGIMSQISNTLSSAWDSIWGTVQNVMTNISNKVSEIWNGIKTTISNAINEAKEAVSKAIEAIKGFFNFEWKIPKPKIPKFTVSGGEAPWGFGGKGSLPSIGVEWFAKGGILTKPTIFGMNGNIAMAGGEAGSEAVLPLNEKTLGMIGDRIMATVADKLVVNVKNQPQTVLIQLNGRTIAEAIVGEISDLQANRLITIEQGGVV